MCTYVYACVQLRMCACICACVCECVVCMCVCVCVCVCVYMCVVNMHTIPTGSLDHALYRVRIQEHDKELKHQLQTLNEEKTELTSLVAHKEEKLKKLEIKVRTQKEKNMALKEQVFLKAACIKLYVCIVSIIILFVYNVVNIK